MVGRPRQARGCAGPPRRRRAGRRCGVRGPLSRPEARGRARRSRGARRGPPGRRGTSIGMPPDHAARRAVSGMSPRMHASDEEPREPELRPGPPWVMEDMIAERGGAAAGGRRDARAPAALGELLRGGRGARAGRSSSPAAGRASTPHGPCAAIAAAALAGRARSTRATRSRSSSRRPRDALVVADLARRRDGVDARRRRPPRRARALITARPGGQGAGVGADRHARATTSRGATPSPTSRRCSRSRSALGALARGGGGGGDRRGARGRGGAAAGG